MNVFEQKNAELVTELTGMFGSIGISPGGFRQMHWWLC